MNSSLLHFLIAGLIALTTPAMARTTEYDGPIDTTTFLEKSTDILFVRCINPQVRTVPNEPDIILTQVEILAVYKGKRKIGIADLAYTSSPMQAGKRYLMASFGNSGTDLDFLAKGGKAVTEIPSFVSLQSLEDKKLEDKVQAIFNAAAVRVTDPMHVLVILLAVLGILFGISQHKTYGRIFKVVPILIFAYFIPTLLSNLRVIPVQGSFPLYTFVTSWLLPASLFLLTLSVDIPGIFRLGPKVLILFLASTLGIVIGGPLAYLAFGWLLPPELGDQTWRGLSALSGSWIGGGANMIAIARSTGASSEIFGLMVIVDVAIANIWMAFLLYFAGRNKDMDEAIGADRKALDDLREKVEKFQGEIKRPTKLADLLLILSLAFGATLLAKFASTILPEIGDIIKQSTWVVILITAFGVGSSFTPLRKLEGAGASAIGSVFLYLLVTTIGAKGDFSKISQIPVLLLIGAAWMAFHALSILWLQRKMKAPIFFAAVGSKSNIGGAASAPIVAHAFHPTLAPVGVLLAVGGYVLGTYAGLLCAFLLQQVYLLTN